MRFRAPLGHSDFLKLRRAGVTYVDKTALVAEVLEAPAEVLLLPRPRRFGKTLNLSTLRYFLERDEEDRSDLFEGLAVWDSEAAQCHFQRYPVISLTFKDVKARAWEDALPAVGTLLSNECRRHPELEETLTGVDRGLYDALCERRADRVTLWSALQDLSRWLAEAHGEPVVILVDEYDTPIHAGYVHGYYEDAVEFFRNFFSGGLKDNRHLFRGLVTGILRVARESIFSGLNNLIVHSLLSGRYATAFGFTEAEVQRLVDLAGARDRLDELREWYDGYLFGGQVVYNPWSVLSFLANPGDGTLPYWVSTSSNDVLRDLLARGGLGSPGALETLLTGGGVDRRIEENVVFRDLDRRADAVWSLLLFSGYLKAADVRRGEETRAVLSIPNREVQSVYRSTFTDWLQAGLGGSSRVRSLLEALLSGDVETFEELLEELLLTALSYHDTARRKAEATYHAFILGLLVQLEPDYEVRSNREAGLGRADVLVCPRQPGRAGVVLELKSVNARRSETPEQALDAAQRQLAERDYAAELRARGADPVHELAAVFDGKRAYVRRGAHAWGVGRTPPIGSGGDGRRPGAEEPTGG